MPTGPRIVRFIDLFCGVGGFRLAAAQACNLRGHIPWCVFSSDIDDDACNVYEANFGERPKGDITKIEGTAIPNHDVLFAGFPCQPFSICGDKKGFDDTRGTLFFDIARILDAKHPPAFLLENVKMLHGHDEGRTLKVILSTLDRLGYWTDSRILNALDFGVPQKRERIFIVGFSKLKFQRRPMLVWPDGGSPMPSLESILEDEVDAFYYASERIRASRQQKINGSRPQHATIWHENKGGHVSAYPYSCAQRAGASYNYLLVNGERRLTEREMFRLNGFPDSFRIPCDYQAARKLAGNGVVVPCVRAVIGALLEVLAIDIFAQPVAAQTAIPLHVEGRPNRVPALA